MGVSTCINGVFLAFHCTDNASVILQLLWLIICCFVDPISDILCPLRSCRCSDATRGSLCWLCSFACRIFLANVPNPAQVLGYSWHEGWVQQYNLDVQTPVLFLEDLGGIRMIRMLECLIHTDSTGWCGDWRSCMVSPATRQGAVELQIGNFDLLKDF